MDFKKYVISFRHVLSLGIVVFSTFLVVSAAQATVYVPPSNNGWPYDPDTNLKDLHLSYSVTLNPDNSFGSGIYDILTFNQYSLGGGVWWESSVSDSGGTINDPFAKSTTNMPLSGLMIGLVDDAETNTHLVLMTSNSFASDVFNAEDKSFESIFSGHDESLLVSSIQYTMENNREADSTDQDLWDADLNNIYNFAFNSSMSTVYFNLGNLSYPSAPGTIVTSKFAVMEWSDGQQIGSGVASMQYAPVPIPSALILLGSGLVGLAGIRRRFTKD
jgi:hypothetical protein